MNSKAIATFNPDIPVHMTFKEHDWHLLAEYWYPIALARDITEQLGQTNFQWLRHFETHLPFKAMLMIHFPNDSKEWLMNVVLPIIPHS